MKIPVSRKSIVMGLALLAAGAFYVRRDDPVVLSAPEWACAFQDNQWQCSVSFEARNRSQARQTRRVSIRGVQIPADGKHAASKECGEEVIELDLLPFEIERVEATVPMRRKPNDIQVFGVPSR